MYEKLGQLPSLVLERVYLDIHDITNSAISDSVKLNKERFIHLIDIEKSILLGKQPISTLVHQLKTLSLDEVTTQSLAKELLCRYFYLFQDFLGNISDQITALGGDTAVCEGNARSVLRPETVLLSFVRDFFPEVDLYAVDDVIIGQMTLILIEAVEMKMSADALKTRLLTILPAPANEDDNLSYIVDAWISAIQTDTITSDWVWYYRNLADNVINASTTPLYNQPILGYIKEIWDDDTTAYHVREYRLLKTFSLLGTSAQQSLLSEALTEKVKELETKYEKSLFSYILRRVLGEINDEGLGIAIRKDFDLDVAIAGAIRDDLMMIISPIIATISPMVSPSSQSLSAPIIPKHADTPLPPVPDVKKQEINYELIIDQILKDSGLDIKDETVLAKVRAILLTRVRGIRDAIDARESLTVLFSKSGSGLDRQSALTLVKEANKYADMLASGTVPELAIPQPPIMEVSQPAMVETTTVMAGQPSKSVVSSPIRARSRVQKHPSFGVSGHTPVAASVPAPETQKPRFAIEEVEGVPMIVEKKDQAVAVPATSNMPRSSATPVAQSRPIPANLGAVPDNLPLAPTAANQVRPITVRQGGMPSPHKTVLSDVKMAPPRLMDPVEELRAFTIRDFRRLSADPFAAIKHMYQKIKLLEKDSVSRKVAGINAWKANEVSALYTAIGQESFGSGRTIKDSIAARTQQGKPVLSEQEFDALMELNEMLRF